jgi:hypothetical protein
MIHDRVQSCVQLLARIMDRHAPLARRAVELEKRLRRSDHRCPVAAVERTP